MVVCAVRREDVVLTSPGTLVFVTVLVSSSSSSLSSIGKALLISFGVSCSFDFLIENETGAEI